MQKGGFLFFILIFNLATNQYVSGQRERRVSEAIALFQGLTPSAVTLPRQSVRKISAGQESGGIMSNLALRKTSQEFFGGLPCRLASTDTFVVGATPGDTVRITGPWTNNGPIFILNDGVLIFDSADVTLPGNIYITGQGTLTATHSQFFIPQQYFYQRSVLVLNQATLSLSDCRLDFGGMAHNLLVADQAAVIFNNVFQNDWTTAGLYGHPSVRINGTNLAGEYIITDSSDVQFKNTTTLILWHKVPAGATMNWSFPAGDTLYQYVCNSAQTGISGIGYTVSVDSSYDCMWGLMPVNGSSVSISNSTIRAIGLWFTQADTVTVSGLVNNSSYSSFTAPLNDRTLQLSGSSVSTWSLYVFDNSRVEVTGSIYGESGTQGRSQLIASSVFCDGSGGFFWATDTSVSIASGTTVSSYVRSEKNGILIFGYGSVGIAATAIGKSVLIVVQSSLLQDPVAEEGSVVWYQSIDGPVTGYTDNTVNITGSVWLDQGPEGSFMDFNQYAVSYRPSGGSTWIPVITNAVSEIRHSVLCTWNTTGLSAGTYEIRLTGFNNLGDSVDAIKGITLLPGFLGTDEITSRMNATVFPNPAHGILNILFQRRHESALRISLTDMYGKEVLQQEAGMPGDHVLIPVQDISGGLYFLNISDDRQIQNLPVIVE